MPKTDVSPPRLVVVAGYGLGRSFALTKAVTTVGRDPQGDIVMPHSTVSFQHARLTLSDGRVVLEDLGSRNGTFVGIDKIKRRELVEGDLLAFGETQVLKLTYTVSDGSAAPDGSPPWRVDPVGSVPQLLDRLRVESSYTQYEDIPFVLAFFRLDVLRVGGDDPPNTETAMTEIAAAICGAFSPRDLCVRTGERELVVALRSSVKHTKDAAERAWGRAMKRVPKTASVQSPFGITVALLPLANVLALAPSEVLTAASERARQCMSDLINEIVTLPPLAAKQIR
jgi:hypothetical protein